MINISNPVFQDETKARKWLEAIRWPDGPFCPHCGDTERNSLLKGKKHRPGLYQCYSCKKQFSVTVGTIFERSHIPLHKWIMASYLLCASKKGISSHQLHRMLGVTYKTAWFMTHRLREAMRESNLKPMGGGGKTVEADETFWGQKGKQRKGARGWEHKEKIFTLVERGGRARSFHVPKVNASTLRPILKQQLRPDTRLMTDEARHYRGVGKEFASHQRVRHMLGEYVRGNSHTNTVENYFSILKRGLTGIYQHVSPQHLKRYVCEFDFRYNHRGLTDAERTVLALHGIEGKRLTYGGPQTRPTF